MFYQLLTVFFWFDILQVRCAAADQGPTKRDVVLLRAG